MAPRDLASPSDSEFRHHFLTDSPVVPAGSRCRTIGGFGMSLVAHGLAALIVGIAVTVAPGTETKTNANPKRERPLPVVWTMDAPGDLPGGGGEENERRPASAAQLPGRQSAALRVRQAITLAPAETLESPAPPRELILPEPAITAGLLDAVGAIAEVRTSEIVLRGPGSGTGADGGRGPGVGPRDGPGFGAGDGEVPGNGVSWPRLIQEVKPNYTPDAMRARIEGMVELEILILPDGSVGRVNLVRSLDSRFGLDDEAIRAVRGWRFDPGRRAGKAVAVRVGVELSFQLR